MKRTHVAISSSDGALAPEAWRAISLTHCLALPGSAAGAAGGVPCGTMTGGGGGARRGAMLDNIFRNPALCCAATAVLLPSTWPGRTLRVLDLAGDEARGANRRARRV